MDQSGASRFAQLPANEQDLYRKAGRQMVRLAQDYAVPIIYCPPPSEGGEVNGATGCVLELPSGWFVVSASHVLCGYERRLLSGEKLNWQVGRLPPFDPLTRVVWRDRQKDTLLLRLSEDEARQVGSCIASASAGWPPPVPEKGQLVLVAGYPRVFRELSDALDKIESGYVASMFRVTTIGDGYFTCQIEQTELVSFSEKPLLDADTDMGGLSGGPALLVGKLIYPLVGVVSEYHGSFRILRIATLEGVTV